MPILRGTGLKMRRILLTGGTGFVGRYLAPALLKSFPGCEGVIVSPKGSAAQIEGWCCEQADITDESAAEALIGRYRADAILHLAAQASAGQSVGAAELTWRVNYGGSFALARAAARHVPGCLFFFASSADVYGKSFSLGPASEETPPAPVNAYAASKLAAELMLRDVLPASCRLIVARAFNHSGPGQDERFVLPAFAAQIARIESGLCEPVLRSGNLEAERDFLHVADVVEAYVGLLAQAQSLPERSLFNVASGKVHRIGDLLEMLRGLARTHFEVKLDPKRARPSDIPRAQGDAARILNTTGWKPTRQVAQLLSELVEWWRFKVANNPSE
jgi:GDP-4-dehydro-6-deoxy-D-mannose reductase